MSAELDHIWSQVQAELGHAVDESTYRIWLEGLRAVEFQDARLTVSAEGRTVAWIDDRFGDVLSACVAAVLGSDVRVLLVPRESAGMRGSRASSSSPAGAAPPGAAADPADRGLQAPREHHAATLNPKLTFDQYVIGDSNRLAHAAALAVAEMPAQAYNPLFICGPPGLGKTHLLHSIATYLTTHSGGLSVRYTTGEAFTNEFVTALRDGSLQHFKNGFRRVDVLLVDDVQFLERKTRTEEEFFHTFNALFDIGSQLVLTSDRLPRDLEALEDRLRERFEAGLVADVRPPDRVTRQTILRKRIDHDGVAVVDPAAVDVIAERVTDNIRALEGALIRIVAFSSLTGRQIDGQLALDVLDGLYPGASPPRRSIADVQTAACAQFGLSSGELLSPSRVARVAWPRQVAMYLARELTDESLPTIGREFGGRDHTTVLHAWKRTAERIANDGRARDSVQALLQRLDQHPS